LDYATIKYDTSGAEQWVARYNGPGNFNDDARAIAVDVSGNVSVTGASTGLGGIYDYATIKYDAVGAEQWVARYNGPGNLIDIARGIGVDGSGNIYVTGESFGSGTNYDYATIKYVQGATPTPTPTSTPSPTPTATVTPSPTATATATPTPTSTPVACVRGQGYWKNHPDQWPVTELQLGNVTYTQDELLSFLRQPVNGNGLVSLAHHLIAAKLNVANGADSSCIQQTIADADALIGDLVVPPVGDGYLAPRDVEALKDILEDYNEGRLCAPSCDQGPTTPTPTSRARPTPAPRTEALNVPRR
jgi:hypothetical protein